MAGQPNELELRAKELHDNLSSAERVDPETREALVVLLGDIDRLLKKPTAAATEEPVDRLTEAAQRFQAEHPTLAGTLEGLADALGRMGI
jgi:hypothetical protein